jgi:hypothetical protein
MGKQILKPCLGAQCLPLWLSPTHSLKIFLIEPRTFVSLLVFGVDAVLFVRPVTFFGFR